MMRRLKLYGIAMALVSLFSVVCPTMGFAENFKTETMERKCEATNVGREADDQVKKTCALYFEQTEANAVTGVAEEAARSVSSSSSYNSMAYLALGLGIIGAVIAPIFF